MSEHEQTGSAGPGQPSRGEPDTDLTASREAPHGAGGVPDIPWSPPQRRATPGLEDRESATDGAQGSALGGARDETAEETPDETIAGAQAGGAGPRTRSARRAAGAGDGAGSADELDRPAGSHPLDGMDAEPEGSEGTGPDDGPRERSRVLWAVIGGAVAVVVAAVVVFALLSRDDAEPAAQTVTTTIELPTPTVEPLDRTGATALVQALPGTVRQFVLGTVEPAEELDGSLEAWTATYSGQVLGEDGTPVDADGATESAPGETSTEAAATGDADQDPAADAPSTGAPAFTVTVGQWEDAEQATAGAQLLAADLGEATSTEDVTVAGEVTGSLSYYSTDSTTGTAVWTNGTVAIRAVGPSSELVNFATAFGL